MAINTLSQLLTILQKGLSVIEAARQNVLATFPLKNTSDKLPLVASGSFSSPLAGGSSPVKVPSKRHTQVSSSVVSTTSKSPKIFNNRPVNKLVFPAFTTPTTTTTTTSQMATKAKNSKKQQQAVTTAMVTLNSFVVPDEILGKISTAAASPLPDMDGNSSSTSSKMGQDQPLAVLPDVVLSSRSLPIPVAKQSINPDDLKDWADQMEKESTVLLPVSGVTDGGAWENVNGHQRFSGWVASNLVSVAIGNEIFLTTFKIAWSTGVAFVSSLSLSVTLHDVSLDTFSDDIKTALGIFGVVTSVKLKSAGLWQYAVVHFKDTSSAATALSYWFVLVRKDSVRILPIANQKEIISSRDTFKAKLINLPFGCTAFEISDLVFQVGGCTCFIPCFPDSYQHQWFAVVTFDSLESLNIAVSKTGTLHGCRIWWETPGCHCCYRCQGLDHLALECKVSPPLLPKVPSNFSGGPKVFKSSFARSKSYAKAAAFVVPSIAAAADVNLDLGGPPPPNYNAHVACFEPVGTLVALVTKLLSTPSAVDISVKECVDGLAKQNKDLAAVATVMQKRLTHLETISEWICLENRSDVDDMVDDIDNDNDDEDKDFSVYDNTFNVMMHLWEEQSSRIKSSSDQTAKWMSGMVKNSHELVSIMGKMYELDMFDTLGSKGSTSM
ncbi:hypothetical protein G9A89_002767 [Geosiphon pyriformis]|nr:hypothetical protein G9A89_002767 [Geosiphon pyriformis]